MVLYPQINCQLRQIKDVRRVCSIFTSSSLTTKTEEVEDEFRVFDIRSGKTKEEKRVDKFVKPPNLPPREKSMPVDQHWPSVWPGPRTFHPASVPLPIRQGWDRRGKVISPGKYANTELMKLPNFLHLTPPAIKRHCDALKKFCTPWPEELSTDTDVREHFPLEIVTTDYCFSSPKIKDPKARVVTFKYPLKRLNLDKHSEDKIQRLLGERYNPETDEITLVSDRCPSKKQNYEYNKYLMLATFFEASNVEPWEAEKSEEDMEYYEWDNNKSRKSYIRTKYWPQKLNESEISKISLEDDPVAQTYKEAVTKLFDNGENIENLFKYKEAVLKVAFQNT